MDPTTVGSLAGAGAAFCWAVGSLIFSRFNISAAALNTCKNFVASFLLFSTMLVFYFQGGGTLLNTSLHAWTWLGISGMIGLVMGDYCYFRSLQILGPRLALVITLSCPPIAALLAKFALGEDPSGKWVGMLITLAGVAWVIIYRGDSRKDSAGHFSGSLKKGILFGLGGSVGQAVGAVLSKNAMQGQAFPFLATTSEIPVVDPLEASFIRLLFAAGAGIAYMLISGKSKEWIPALTSRDHLPRLIGAISIGTYCGIWLSQIAFEKAQLSVATTLTSLTPIFVIPLVWIFLKQKTHLKAMLGVGIGLIGVAILVNLI